MSETDRSFAGLIDDAIGNLQHLLRAEIRLAKTELHEEALQARAAALFTAAGAAAAFIGVGILLLGAVYALALVLPAWLAAVLVGFVVAVAGGILLLIGRQRFRQATPPMDRTVRSTKETLQWAKHQIR